MPTLIDLLDSSGVDFRRVGEDRHVSRKGSWIGLRCPWCQGSEFHLGIDTVGGRCNCWKCGRRSSVDALSLILRVPKADLSGLWGRRVFRSREEDPRRTGVFRPPRGIHDIRMGGVHWDYLRDRGFDPEEVSSLWGVRATSQASEIPWSLYIPIYDKSGLEVSWTTRRLSNRARPRYVSSSPDREFVEHKSILYGAHLARWAVIVVEGPADAWAIGPGAVATFGTSISANQFTALIDYPTRYLAFDADAGDVQDRLFSMLEPYSGTTESLILETGDDPASCDPEEIQEVREKFLKFS